MKSPEQQAKEEEEKNKSLIERTIQIPLTDKQVGIINEIKQDQSSLQEKLMAANKREQDLINFTLEFKGIDVDKLESVRLDGKKIIVVKKEEVKETKEVEKENKKLEEVELESNHK